MTTHLPSSRSSHFYLAYGLWLLLLALLPLATYATEPGRGATPALHTVLNPDGALQADARGSFDTQGHTLGRAATGQSAFCFASVRWAPATSAGRTASA